MRKFLYIILIFSLLISCQKNEDKKNPILKYLWSGGSNISCFAGETIDCYLDDNKVGTIKPVTGQEIFEIEIEPGAHQIKACDSMNDCWQTISHNFSKGEKYTYSITCGINKQKNTEAIIEYFNLIP